MGGKDEKGKSLSSGIYFYRLTSGGVDESTLYSDTKKLILIK
jgi:hypothetical protein